MKARDWWFALLLVGSSIISVSPNSSTTAITTFQPSYLKTASSTTITSKLDLLQNYMVTTPTSRITSAYENMLVKHIQFPQRRIERDTPQDSVVSPCQKFEVGDEEQKTFYSPNHPNNYPKNIDCIRILKAQEGHIIRLDFRESFNIEEKEDCKFDFLEIRDGAYGFSDLIGKYCGDQFPSILHSSGQHMWLHFHSDESIEYSGFTAVYEFVKTDIIKEDLNCTIVKESYEGLLNKTDIGEALLTNIKTHNLNLDCMWRIVVNDDWKIQLKFIKFELEKPNDCDANYLDIFNGKTDIPSRVRNFCGSAADTVTSTQNKLFLRFFAKSHAINSTFEAMYTAFRERKGTDPCAETEFDCEDATCIHADLRCNGRDNCKFRADEEDCHTATTGQSEHVIIIIVIFGLILGGMVITFLVNCIRKILRDQKIIREHIRQSKESKLNEMGRASAKRSKENLSVKLSPREKHSQSSLQILDDVSKRYYREIVPITVQDTPVDVKDNSILRQQHDIIVQTSLGDDNLSSSERGTCEMGCQTRESLFQPVGWKTSVCSSSPDETTAIRFSTFGYDTPPNKAQTLSRQSTNKDKTRMVSAAIEVQETEFTEIPPRGPEICLHHHQHQQHLQQQHKHQGTRQATPSGKGKQKTDESKVFIDIRNSAPDVIIMTSH